MIRTIDGRKYLMRYQATTAELRKLHAEFCVKYRTNMDIHQWLGERGKVHIEIKEENNVPR
jgi:hypothetical protein